MFIIKINCLVLITETPPLHTHKTVIHLWYTLNTPFHTPAHTLAHTHKVTIKPKYTNTLKPNIPYHNHILHYSITTLYQIYRDWP